METRKKKALIIFTIVAVVLFFSIFLVSNATLVTSFLKDMAKALRPIVIGFIIAYLFAPIHKGFLNLFRKIKYEGFKVFLATLCTGIIFLAIIFGVVFLIVPQLVESITEFIGKIDEYVTETVGVVNNIIDKINEVSHNIGEDMIPHISAEDILNSETRVSVFSMVFEKIYEFLTSNLTTIGSWLKTFVVSFYDVVIGLIFAFLYLIFREQIVTILRKIGYAIMSKSVYKRTGYVISVTNNSFGGFLKGKIIDSVIIGFLAYFCFWLFKMPYPILLATFIGITNVIPFIGPIIGAIPTGIIVLLVEPIKAIPFLILVIIIQQLDGNVIGPTILGSNTGVSALCVMIAITVFGEIWGLVGMLLGVPIFATLLYILDEITVKKLKEKGKDASIVEYYDNNIPDADAFTDARRKKQNLIQKWRSRVYKTRAHMSDAKIGDRFLLNLYNFFVKLHIMKEPKPFVMDNPSITREIVVIPVLEPTSEATNVSTPETEIGGESHV